MKNKLLIVTALVFSLRAGAQNSQNGNSDDKSASMYRNLDGSRFSRVPEPVAKGPEAMHTIASAKASDYYCMKHDKVYAVVNGTSTSLETYARLQDGTVIMPNGSVITGSGKVVHLKNGEHVNILGAFTCFTGEAGKKEQAAGTEN